MSLRCDCGEMVATCEERESTWPTIAATALARLRSHSRVRCHVCRCERHRSATWRILLYNTNSQKDFGKAFQHASSCNTRLKDACKYAQLEELICAKIRGCNVCRHADTKANRKRRALTPAERQEEKKKAAKRLSSVQMTDEAYDQPSS